ncbi:type II secretion system GspH family protein [Clostridium gasigenes]|uniref:type IV pilus modification PilV family protein n=1 Tax=Clostridium gasigenes TaxID=94869 RepID=UPI001C0DF556|nr:type II secretion system protein [Clostridium gasigenes]MBU3137900.1 type II secretion system GspH family protein [Clostridium gasigenes]
MTNKYTRKKGMTLIEAIISVALFSILIIPISGLVMTAMKTSEKAEAKQRASYVGQSILEEMEVYDEILLKTESGEQSFMLLDGGIIKKSAEVAKPNIYNGEIDRDGFKVDVTLIKDNDFEYKTSNEVDSSESEMDFKLELSKDSMGKSYVKRDITPKEISTDLVLKLDQHGNMILKNKDNETDSIINVGKVPNRKNKISIELNENFDDVGVNIEVQNEILDAGGNKEELKIYIKTPVGSNGTVNVIGVKGKVKIYENIGVTPIGETGDLYNIQVDVKKDANVIFTGKTTKNIIIK